MFFYHFMIFDQDKNSECSTCKKKLEHCAGHFGHIQLELPVFHAGFFKHTLTILQAICKACSRILLPESDRLKYLAKLQGSRIDSLARNAIFKKVVETCKKDSHSGTVTFLFLFIYNFEPF